MLGRNLLHHLIIQYVIILFPPVAAALMFDVNQYISNFFEEFVGYSVGITGLVFMGILSSFLHNELVVTLIFLVIKIFALYPFFVIMYLKLKKARWLPVLISSLLSLWGVIFGVFWMFSAMQ
ncbi:hypothetical protein DFP95_14227 [Cohnella lupini]|uniref:Uncharacterized protein n=1 Tax=Cohnella lupini TaxID=1294267 RepID=A0A3D9HQ96_9BACL|nr:hypothetical protein DFP95_14227 [Cohnella lupini]